MTGFMGSSAAKAMRTEAAAAKAKAVAEPRAA